MMSLDYDSRYREKIVTWLIQDHHRMKVLEFVSALALPQCYVAAGFVRNLVWDHLHGVPVSTPLNDIDVVYFDEFETDARQSIEYEKTLSQQMPSVSWDVNNQAWMHHFNKDRPYANCRDAMRFWPEKETAVGIRKMPGEKLNFDCISGFGLESLFSLKLTHNPVKDETVFLSRVNNKKWLERWPNLELVF